MKHLKMNNALKPLLVTIALLAGVVWAIPSFAHEIEEIETPADARLGFFVGVGAGCGGTVYGYKDGSRSITEDPWESGMGNLRAGYAFSRKFALSLEAFGFGVENDDEEDWGMGAGIIAATWRPLENGFYVHGGVGAGGGEFYLPGQDEKVIIKERGAFLFRVGYDWDLNERFTLGLGFNVMAIEAGKVTENDEDFLGSSGVTLQLNWFI